MQAQPNASTRTNGETDDVVTLFSDKYLPALDLLQREGNRIGVGEKRDPIAGIVQRCAPLQLLEVPAFDRQRQANADHADRCLPVAGVSSLQRQEWDRH